MCLEEHLPQGFVRSERTRDSPNDRVGGAPVLLRLVFLSQLAINVPRCGMDLPGCDRDLKSLRDFERLEHKWLGLDPRSSGDSDSGLHLPSKRLQIGIIG